MHRTALAIGALSLASAASAQATLPEPPDLAKPSKYQTNIEVVVLDAPLEEAWAFWRENSITDYLEPTDRIPAIAGFTVLKGPWGEPGSIRRVEFEGGGSALERVLTADEDEFTYQIWNIETGSGRFINHIHGQFFAAEVDGRTEITWRYNIKPAVFFARPAIRSFLANDFDPFMEGGMAGLSAEFERVFSQ
jgi:hypothetical protein